MDDHKAPLLNHLTELRSCIVKAISGLAISMSITYFFAGHIMEWLKKPMMEVMPTSSSFVVLAPQEYFFTELKASLFFGVIVASPWLFYQLWSFIAPGLYANEKRMVAWFVMAASACFVVGVLFAYYLVFPPTFKFFIETLPPGVNGAYSISMLYGFAMTVLLAFGIVFQTPIAVFLLAVFELIPLATFAQYRRVVFVACFIIGAILTPPDPITQVMLALPTYALFELGLFFSGLVLKKRKPKEA
jgi:sec-independent protein translocase protein TatC